MKRQERGATLVEAALVVPLILILIFGLLEFGRYIVITSTVTNASHEAARYAAGNGPGSGSTPRYADCAGMRTAARQFGVVGQPTNAQISLRFDKGPGTGVFLNCLNNPTVDHTQILTGHRIRATVTVPFQPIVPLIGAFLGPTNISVETTRTINKG